MKKCSPHSFALKTNGQIYAITYLLYSWIAGECTPWPSLHFPEKLKTWGYFIVPLAASTTHFLWKVQLWLVRTPGSWRSAYLWHLLSHQISSPAPLRPGYKRPSLIIQSGTQYALRTQLPSDHWMRPGPHGRTAPSDPLQFRNETRTYVLTKTTSFAHYLFVYLHVERGKWDPLTGDAFRTHFKVGSELMCGPQLLLLLLINTIEPWTKKFTR